MAGSLTLLDRVCDQIRLQNYGICTGWLHVKWVRKYILHHGKRHPLEMEALRLRVQDVDFAARQIPVRDGKGGRGMTSPLNSE